MPVMGTFEWLTMGLIATVPYMLLIILVQHVLGYYLSKKYDPHFFKSPYFTEGEVAVYSSWPLSLIRYATYIVFAGFPWLVQKRRFKGHASPYLPGAYLKLGCQLWLICTVLGILSVPTLFWLMWLQPVTA